MLHKTAVTLIVLASALSFSRLAHADVVCGDYLSGDYQPDEMTTTASQAKAEAIRSCVCYANCSAQCYVYAPVEESFTCGIGGDPLFATVGDVDACNACIGAVCGDELVACYLDS